MLYIAGNPPAFLSGCQDNLGYNFSYTPKWSLFRNFLRTRCSLPSLNRVGSSLIGRNLEMLLMILRMPLSYAVLSKTTTLFPLSDLKLGDNVFVAPPVLQGSVFSLDQQLLVDVTTDAKGLPEIYLAMFCVGSISAALSSPSFIPPFGG